MKRGYDESNSPQWRYLLSRESEIKRQRVPHRGGMSALEEAEKLFRPDDGGDSKRNSKNKKERHTRRQEAKGQTKHHKRMTKKAKETT